MKKIAIIRCHDVSMRCGATGCLRALNEKDKAFAPYGDEELRLVSLMTCNGCGQTVENDPGLKKKLDRLIEKQVDVVHLSHCTSKKDKDNPDNRHTCPWIVKIADYLKQNGIQVVEGTH